MTKDKEREMYLCSLDVNLCADNLENYCKNIIDNYYRLDEDDLKRTIRDIYSQIRTMKRYQNPINELKALNGNK